MSRGRCSASRERRGTALVAALALLVLSGALVIGVAAAASASTRSSRAERSVVLADALAQRAASRVVAGWDPSALDLTIGGSTVRALRPDELDSARLSAQGHPPSGTVRVQRLDRQLFAIAVEVRLGGAGGEARRRRMLLVAVPADSVVADTSAPRVPPSPGRPRRINRWSGADLF